MVYLAGFFVSIGFCIASAVLANRKGRNPVNWFFITVFWSFLGLIILACSKTLEEGEKDSLSKVLWAVIMIPIVAVGILFCVDRMKEHKVQIQRQEEMEEIVQPAETPTTHSHSHRHSTTSNPVPSAEPYLSPEAAFPEMNNNVVDGEEVLVDLNDYLTPEEGWDENTDWNHTSLDSDEEVKAFKETIKKNGIYYSEKMGGWVKFVPSIVL